MSTHTDALFWRTLAAILFSNTVPKLFTHSKVYFIRHSRASILYIRFHSIHSYPSRSTFYVTGTLDLYYYSICYFRIWVIWQFFRSWNSHTSSSALPKIRQDYQITMKLPKFPLLPNFFHAYTCFFIYTHCIPPIFYFIFLCPQWRGPGVCWKW